MNSAAGRTGRLAAAKAKGITLGNPNLAKARVVANVLPVIKDVKATGASLRQIAAALNCRGILTARGCRWADTQVLAYLHRAI